MTLSVNLLKSLKSVYTDHELATHMKVAVIYFIYSLDVFSDGQMFLFIIR